MAPAPVPLTAPSAAARAGPRAGRRRLAAQLRAGGWLGLALIAGWAGPALGHGTISPLSIASSADPDQVVPQNGGADPSGEASSAEVFVTLDDVDPSASVAVVLTGIDVLELQALQVRVGAPGSNGPKAFDLLADPDVSISPGFVLGIWSDDDEDLGGDGQRDPEDTIALSDALGDLIDGNLYLEIATLAYPPPDTAELRGQIERALPPEVLIGLEDGHLATGERDGAVETAGVRVFEAHLLQHPGLGGRVATEPVWVSSATPPVPLGPAPGGTIAFDVLVEPETGLNVSYWDGLLPVGFGPVPSGHSLELTSGPDLVSLLGGAVAETGFPIGSLAADGSGLDAHLETFLEPPGILLSGFYVVALQARLYPDDLEDVVFPSPRFWMLWNFGLDDATVAQARSYIESSWAVAECADGFDNDGDGDVDLADAGCSGAGDASEYASVPEPSAGVAGGAGALALAGLARRRRRSG